MSMTGTIPAPEVRANFARGEATLTITGTQHLLRPTFGSLVMAEEELGSLFALVERAGAGELKLAEITALFWHCLADQTGLTRDDVGKAVMDMGLARASKPLRTILHQILQGQS